MGRDGMGILDGWAAYLAEMKWVWIGGLVV